MFSNGSLFHKSLIFVGKSGSQPFELSPVKGSTLVCSSQMNGKHSKLIMLRQKLQTLNFKSERPRGESNSTFLFVDKLDIGNDIICKFCKLV